MWYDVKNRLLKGDDAFPMLMIKKLYTKKAVGINYKIISNVSYCRLGLENK